MISLFSKSSLLILESFSFTQTLYAFDFDGTLAKIVRIPNAAKMTERTENLLKQLNELVPVAIISGRSIKDLEKRLNFRPRFLVGNHGLEGLGKANSSLEKAAQISAKWADFLKKQNFLSGVEVEHKHYSIAIHYRRSRNKTVAKKQILEAIASLTPEPRIITGKSVYNLVPPEAPHKGVAILEILKICNARNAFYIGDDDTDEDVFSMPYTEGQLMKVRVGLKRKSSATYFIENQSDINKLLQLLIHFHRAPINKNVEARCEPK